MDWSMDIFKRFGLVTVLVVIFRYPTEINGPSEVHGFPEESQELYQWSVWSPCSRTCGIGVQFRGEICLRKNKALCVEKPIIYQTCNTQACPSGGASFRDLQCGIYNDRNIFINGHRAKWVSYLRGGHPCLLFCYPQGEELFYYFGKAKDGTQCSKEPRGVCIRGRCKPVGCDNVLESGVYLDKCRLCGGNSTLCQPISGRIERPPNHFEKMSGYAEVMVIPRGSTSVFLSDESWNYLAVKRQNGDYVFNGHRIINWSGFYKVGDVEVQYTKFSNNIKETVQIPGPTEEDIYITSLLITGKLNTSFEYWIPINNTKNSQDAPEVDSYLQGHRLGLLMEWGSWTSCSATCGGGIKVRARTLGNVAVSSFGGRETDVLRCNEVPCDKMGGQWSEWGPWDDCSTSCGGGARMRFRNCKKRSQAVESSSCPGDRYAVELCNSKECPTEETRPNRSAILDKETPSSLLTATTGNSTTTNNEIHPTSSFPAREKNLDFHKVTQAKPISSSSLKVFQSFNLVSVSKFLNSFTSSKLQLWKETVSLLKDSVSQSEYRFGASPKPDVLHSSPNAFLVSPKKVSRTAYGSHTSVSQQGTSTTLKTLTPLIQTTSSLPSTPLNKNSSLAGNIRLKSIPVALFSYFSPFTTLQYSTKRNRDIASRHTSISLSNLQMPSSIKAKDMSNTNVKYSASTMHLFQPSSAIQNGPLPQTATSFKALQNHPGPTLPYLQLISATKKVKANRKLSREISSLRSHSGTLPSPRITLAARGEGLITRKDSLIKHSSRTCTISTLSHKQSVMKQGAVTSEIRKEGSTFRDSPTGLFSQERSIISSSPYLIIVTSSSSRHHTPSMSSSTSYKILSSTTSLKGQSVQPAATGNVHYLTNASKQSVPSTSRLQYTSLLTKDMIPTLRSLLVQSSVSQCPSLSQHFETKGLLMNTGAQILADKTSFSPRQPIFSVAYSQLSATNDNLDMLNQYQKSLSSLSSALHMSVSMPTHNSLTPKDYTVASRKVKFSSLYYSSTYKTSLSVSSVTGSLSIKQNLATPRLSSNSGSTDQRASMMFSTPSGMTFHSEFATKTSISELESVLGSLPKKDILISESRHFSLEAIMLFSSTISSANPRPSDEVSINNVKTLTSSSTGIFIPLALPLNSTAARNDTKNNWQHLEYKTTPERLHTSDITPLLSSPIRESIMSRNAVFLRTQSSFWSPQFHRQAVQPTRMETPGETKKATISRQAPVTTSLRQTTSWLSSVNSSSLPMEKGLPSWIINLTSTSLIKLMLSFTCFTETPSAKQLESNSVTSDGSINFRNELYIGETSFMTSSLYLEKSTSQRLASVSRSLASAEVNQPFTTFLTEALRTTNHEPFRAMVKTSYPTPRLTNGKLVTSSLAMVDAPSSILQERLKLVPQSVHPTTVNKTAVSGSRVLGEEKQRCGPCVNLVKVTRAFCNSDFVVRVRILSEAINELSLDTDYRVRLIRPFKMTNSSPTIRSIWIFNNTCRCPLLLPGKQYLLMGKLTRLVGSTKIIAEVSRESYVKVWKDWMLRRMQKLRERCRLIKTTQIATHVNTKSASTSAQCPLCDLHLRLREKYCHSDYAILIRVRSEGIVNGSQTLYFVYVKRVFKKIQRMRKKLEIRLSNDIACNCNPDLLLKKEYLVLGNHNVSSMKISVLELDRQNFVAEWNVTLDNQMNQIQDNCFRNLFSTPRLDYSSHIKETLMTTAGPTEEAMPFTTQSIAEAGRELPTTLTTPNRPDKCRSCRLSKKRNKNYCESDFVIRAKIVQSSFDDRTQERKYLVKVITVFRHLVEIKTVQEIFVQRDFCQCPELLPQKQYVLMGTAEQISISEHRLLIPRKPFVKIWQSSMDARFKSIGDTCDS